MPRIAIIGGGISGVSVAYELSRQGNADFVLYEAANRLGGTVETHREAGFVFECGPDSWVTEKPWARELAVELGLESEIIPSNDDHRRTYILQGGQLVAMPDGMRMMVPTDLDAIAASPLFTDAAREAYSREVLRAEELKAFAADRPEGWDEPVASFVERHFGGEVVEKIAGPLLAGVFGGDIRQLSAAAVMAPFLTMEREHGSLILALQRRSGAANQPVFTTLRNGLGTLIDAMAAAIPPARIHLQRPVASIVRGQSEWLVATDSGEAAFDRVVLATPVHITRRLVAPWQPELQSLLAIEATSSVVVAMAFDREQASSLRLPEGFGFLVPQRSGPYREGVEPRLLACTFVDQKFSDRAPDGCVLLRAFYGGDSAPMLLDRPDEFVTELAGRQLSGILGELPQPKIALVRRWPLSLPQYTVGHRARVARIEAIVSEIPGLRLVGNAFHGVGLPDLIRQGRLAAREAPHC